jgi:hypothetical protein
MSRQTFRVIILRFGERRKIPDRVLQPNEYVCLPYAFFQPLTWQPSREPRLRHRLSTYKEPGHD